VQRRIAKGFGRVAPQPSGPDDRAEIGHCVHYLDRGPGDGAGDNLLYQQNHGGVFRSADSGRLWREITPGLPSGSGFPIAVHPCDPGTVWGVPLNGDSWLEFARHLPTVLSAEILQER